MSRRSLDSERPIMAPSVHSKRTSTTTNPRPYSTYSTTFTLAGSPSFHSYSNSTATAATTRPLDPTGTSSTDTTSTAPPNPAANLETTGLREITSLTNGLKRLENKPLSQQRFVMPQRKGDEMSKLALGAKVERALGRRMADQDAVFRVRSKKRVAGDAEKVGLHEVKA